MPLWPGATSAKILLRREAEPVTWLRSHAAVVLATVSILMWVSSLCLPASEVFLAYEQGVFGVSGVRSLTYGFECLLEGWLAPVVPMGPPGHGFPGGYVSPLPYLGFGSFSLATVAWFANPLWAWNVIRMLRSRPPRILVALIAAALAVTALQPYYMEFGDDQGVNSNTIPLVGSYIWAAGIALPLVSGVALEFARRRLGLSRCPPKPGVGEVGS